MGAAIVRRLAVGIAGSRHRRRMREITERARKADALDEDFEHLGRSAPPPRSRDRSARRARAQAFTCGRAVMGRGHRRDPVRALSRRRRAARHLREARRLRDDLPLGAIDAGASRCTSPGTRRTARRRCADFARQRGLHFDAMNSNTFQDQPGQAHSYKFGSLTAPGSRRCAARPSSTTSSASRSAGALGSTALSVWIGDGGNFPGPVNSSGSRSSAIWKACARSTSALPDDWRLFIEHKLYEPAFYSTVMNDWGTSYYCARELGPKAFCLVDLGHHAPNVNIEMIVARLIQVGKLAGFHFNDSKYGDDDLDAGSIKPFQLFLVFNELVDAELGRRRRVCSGVHAGPVAQRDRSDRVADGERR